MAQSPKNKPVVLPDNLVREVTLVFVAQMAAIVGLVQLDESVGLGGGLHALVGLVFIFLPVLVMDRRGRPYARYGLKFTHPLPELPWVLGFMLVTFVPIVFVAPWVWGVAENTWHLVLPDGYPETALAHLAVVALSEEFFYRGYLMGRLDDIIKGRVKVLGARVGWSLLIQAALFAVGHFLVDFNPERLAVFFPALAFGWLRARRGNIIAPVLFHAASNVFMDVFRAGLGL